MLMVKSLLVTYPEFLNVSILPTVIKQQYLPYYELLLDKLKDVDLDHDYNESDVHNYRRSIKIQAQQAINLLGQTAPADQDKLLARMVEHCRKWDTVYQYDALNLYPELEDIFKKYGY
jgi:hypothetical protein